MRKLFLTLASLFIATIALSVVAQDSGTVTINWPPEQNTVSGTVDVVGTVNLPNLDSFFLEVGEYTADGSEPPLWIPISLPQRAPVNNASLGQWATTLVSDGFYQLRLHIVLQDGTNTYYTLAPIAVNNLGQTVGTEPVRVLQAPEGVSMGDGEAQPAQPGVLPTLPPLPDGATTSGPAAEPTPAGPVVVPSPNVVNELPVPVGGHVLHFDETAQEYMRQAGMTWVKWQLPFTIGDDSLFTVALDRINRSHEAGFKVLISVTGSKEELGAMGEEYYPHYASFMGRLAKLGPDALEVWNEMNLDREWPNGQIDPAAYTEMLRQVYEAVKAENPEVMVITGALAPTGAEGAFGLAAVWNDDRYYAGMAAAGADQYADCIGLHYNEGILSPRQLGGDPRQPDYPTRYFQSMLDRVSLPFRNSDIPLCLTEMGYLSGEGYPPLPEGFNWASGVSVAEQAQWLAEAIQIASTYSRPINLIIIWNIDFDNFEQDPMAGYAIIRPDGTCPACQTIGALRQPQQ